MQQFPLWDDREMEPRTGDRVRVVLEGVRTEHGYAFPYDEQKQLVIGDDVAHSVGHSVELVERGPSELRCLHWSVVIGDNWDDIPVCSDRADAKQPCESAKAVRTESAAPMRKGRRLWWR